MGAMTEAVSIVRLLPAARFSIRGGEGATAAIGGAIGLALPREACRAREGNGFAALWLGPDEWLLVADGAEPGDLHARLTAASTEPASIVDISDRQVGLGVSGPKVAEALNAFNALDLDESAFPVGMCTRTLFGKAEIVLWRKADDAFRIEVWRSFAPYVVGCLAEATREYGGLTATS
jgi:sarcosine oxidase subunit gamma